MTEAAAKPEYRPRRAVRGRGPSAPAPGRPIRILTFTTLYPNAVQPHHGVFVETRLRHLLAGGRVAARVVAPVPWFPFSRGPFGRYAAFARVPEREERHGVSIDHPRFPVIPKVGMGAAPALLYRAVAPVVGRMLEAGHDFDLIDAHYFYPDGVAAARLGRRFGRPVVITARGTDVNLLPRYAGPRRRILWAAGEAAAVVTVCQALKDRLVELGVPAGHVEVIRNGVDPAIFRPGGGAGLKHRLGLGGPVLVSAGNLVANKGHDIAIRALTALPEVCLLVVGDGPERARLEALSRKHAVDTRVRFLGAVDPGDMGDCYAAADVLVLASKREGIPNVILEAMACGTPAIATAVGGVPEVIRAPEAGILIGERTPEAVAAAVRRLLDAPPARAATRAYAERFSWDETTERLLDLFARVVGRPRV